MAPQGDMALEAAHDRLAVAAGGWRIHNHGLSRDLQIGGLDDGVDDKAAAGLALAPAAMAAMHDHGFGHHAIAHCPAITTAFHHLTTSGSVFRRCICRT